MAIKVYMDRTYTKLIATSRHKGKRKGNKKYGQELAAGMLL